MGTLEKNDDLPAKEFCFFTVQKYFWQISNFQNKMKDSMLYNIIKKKINILNESLYFLNYDTSNYATIAPIVVRSRWSRVVKSEGHLKQIVLHENSYVTEFVKY